MILPKRLLRLRSAMLSAHLDNIVYRHEIGMDQFGRFRKHSPIYSAHELMLAMLAAVALAFAMGQWIGMMIVSGAELLILAVAAYPVAYWRAFRSLWRERVSGSLEQLILTSITDRQLFEGKYFGAVSPFIEVRRYLLIISFFFCASAAVVLRGYSWVGAATLCLVAINHFGYSAWLGSLGGLRCGTQSTKALGQFMKEWEMNPWVLHTLLILRYGLILIVPLMFLFFVSFLMNVNSPVFLALALTLFVPLASANHLRDRERVLRDQLARRFKHIFSFDANL